MDQELNRIEKRSRKLKKKQNNGKKNLSDKKLQLQGKLDARISDDINFTLGGNFSHHIDMGSSLWWRKQLLNFDNNRQYIRDNYNFYARIQHKLSGDDTQSSVKNLEKRILNEKN